MDPYTVGYITGSCAPLALIGYFVGRKLAGPRGLREIEQLKRAAGVSEPGTPMPSRARGCLPYVCAFGGAVCGLIFGSISFLLQGGAGVDAKKIESGFLSGCEGPCAKRGAPTEACHRACSCMLGELKQRHPKAESLRDFFDAALHKEPAALGELAHVQGVCVPQPAQEK